MDGQRRERVDRPERVDEQRDEGCDIDEQEAEDRGSEKPEALQPGSAPERAAETAARSDPGAAQPLS
jgi:hypothetical protein